MDALVLLVVDRGDSEAVLSTVSVQPCTTKDSSDSAVLVIILSLVLTSTSLCLLSSGVTTIVSPSPGTRTRSSCVVTPPKTVGTVLPDPMLPSSRL